MTVVASAAAGSLALGLLPAGASAPPGSGKLQVYSRRSIPPGRYVSGVDLIGGRGPKTLTRPAFGPLTGEHIAAPSWDGRFIAYDTWRQTRVDDPAKSHYEQGIAPGDILGVPTLHMLDTQTQADRELESGSFSASWSATGALAYTVVQGGGYHADVPNPTRVVVRTSPDAAPAVWTEAGRYRVYGWAGDSLIVWTAVPGETGVTVLALEGPGQQRKLFAGVALLGISPDGTELLVGTELSPPGAAILHRKRISDGGEVASLRLAEIVDPTTKASAQYVDGAADWKGDRILVTTDGGFALLRSVGAQLGVEQTIHLDFATYTSGSLFEPRFADSALQTIVFWTGLPRTPGKDQQAVQFVCDRIALTCVRQPPRPPLLPIHPVYDRSGGQR